jgi:hypothetical protein
MQGWDTFDSLSLSEPVASEQFPEGRVYVQREGELYAIIDCGEVGINGQGSHGHNDMLSFELYYRARTFFSDAGSYVYTGDATARNQFRATAYHNTVMIDGVEINEIYPGQLFVLGNQAQPKINQWESNEEFDLLDAEHNGYLRLPQGIIHRRQFMFKKYIGCWVITDQFSGAGQHQFSFFFNFDSGLALEIANRNRVIATDEETAITLALAPLGNNGLRAELVERYVSKGYGEREKSWGVVYNLTAQAPFTQQFLIAPCSEDDLSGVDELIENLDLEQGTTDDA